jgi:hypothetical protein
MLFYCGSKLEEGDGHQRTEKREQRTEDRLTDGFAQKFEIRSMNLEYQK